jgi:SAM-dependent methyltransferase
MAKTIPFDNYLKEYEQWFDENNFVFLSELEAIRIALPSKGSGVEIGVGSGIFASPLGINEGCDPSDNMRAKAIERGINAIRGIAENLPYKNESFDYALMVTTICFVDDPNQALDEIYRILRPHGELIMAFVDKDSPLGKEYLKHKEKSLFYKDASFYSTEEIYHFLRSSGFSILQTCQTIFNPLGEINEIQQPEDGYNKGSFVVIKAKKMNENTIRLAMAVNHSSHFESKHFCDADKYLMYEWIDGRFVFLQEENNKFKDFDKEKEHGTQKKGVAIIDFLQSLNVNVLVSKQFGKNIQMVNCHFIPVIVPEDTPGQVLEILTKHMKWIEDELKNKSDEFNLFTISKGILKTRIKKS